MYSNIYIINGTIYVSISILIYIYTHTRRCHQTWLAGKSSINDVLMGQLSMYN